MKINELSIHLTRQSNTPKESGRNNKGNTLERINKAQSCFFED